MNVSIEIKNFQSIAHEVVDVHGFTALIGRSNIGKSAIVRAVKAALTGAPAEALVRHSVTCPRQVKGAKSCSCFCSVNIKADGFDLLWEKGDSINRYVYNGTEYTAVNRGTPDFLQKDFAYVKLGDERELLQVVDQFKPIFILNQTGTVVADILSDVVKLEQINAAARYAEKDRKDAASTRKVREQDVKDLEQTLAGYDGLEEAVNKVNAIEAADKAIREAESKLETIESFYDALFDALRRVKALSSIEDVVAPDITPMSTTTSVWESVSRFDQTLQDKALLVSGLSKVESVSVPNLDQFLSSGNAFVSLVSWSLKLEQFKSFFGNTQKLDKITVPEMQEVTVRVGTFATLWSWISKLETLVQTVSKLEKATAENQQSETEVLDEFTLLGVCPTCSRKFDSSANHSHA